MKRLTLFLAALALLISAVVVGCDAPCPAYALSFVGTNNIFPSPVMALSRQITGTL